MTQDKNLGETVSEPDSPKVKVSEPIKAPTRTIDVNGLSVEVGMPPWDLSMDFELLLGERADNQAWMRKQVVFLYVRKINGEEVWPIHHYSEFVALRNRLGRDGYMAVVTAASEISDAQGDALKNSPSTPSSDDAAP